MSNLSSEKFFDFFKLQFKCLLFIPESIIASFIFSPLNPFDQNKYFVDKYLFINSFFFERIISS